MRVHVCECHMQARVEKSRPYPLVALESAGQ